MNPIIATLEVNFFKEFNYAENGIFSDIVNEEFACRKTANMEFLEEAKKRIENHILHNKNLWLKEINKNFEYDDFVLIDDLEVKLECEPYYGNNPKPHFSGSYKFYAKSEEIGILQFLPNHEIVYHTESYPTVRYCMLNESLKCYVKDNFWDLRD